MKTDNSGHAGIIKGCVIGAAADDVFKLRHERFEPNTHAPRFRYLRRRRIVLWNHYPPDREHAIRAEDWLSKQGEQPAMHGCAYVYDYTMPTVTA